MRGPKGLGGRSLLDGPAASGSGRPFLPPTPFPHHPVALLTPKLVCSRGSRRRRSARKLHTRRLTERKPPEKLHFEPRFCLGFSFKTTPLGVSATEGNLREQTLCPALFLKPGNNNKTRGLTGVGRAITMITVCSGKASDSGQAGRRLPRPPRSGGLRGPHKAGLGSSAAPL